LGQSQETIFLTTTVQGFVPVFQSPAIADELVASIIDDCKATSALLHAFVAMPEHIHLLVSLPKNMDAPSRLPT
jgi:REP element-mobilizing transposase RayT